jgi:hypothetical protein
LSTDFITNQLIESFKDRPFVTREELFDLYRHYEPGLKQATFESRLYHLRRKEIIRSIDRKRFSFSYKPHFTPSLENRQKDIFSRVEKQFPDLACCIWSTKWIHEFMLHLPGRYINVLEVGEDAQEIVFHYLQDSSIRNLYFQPHQKEVTYYVFENTDAVVVKSLVTKSPLEMVENTRVPGIEKILVDVFTEKVLFNIFQGSELGFIFNSVYNKYAINFTTMFHYARRRGKAKELKDFLLTKTDIPNYYIND